MACLWTDPLLVTVYKASQEPLQLEVAIKPTMAMMCTSCFVQDEATGMTYMDTFTISMGEWPLGAPAL